MGLALIGKCSPAWIESALSIQPYFLLLVEFVLIALVALFEWVSAAVALWVVAFTG
jgi:hypothetical protein